MATLNLYGHARWRRRRAHQLRAEPLCAFCTRLGRTVPATVADHVEPHRGDLDLFWNGALQSLCKFCHDSVKKRAEDSGAELGCDVDGTPIDPSHHWVTG